MAPSLIYRPRAYSRSTTSILAILGTQGSLDAYTLWQALYRMPSDCWSSGVILYIMLSWVISNSTLHIRPLALTSLIPIQLLEARTHLTMRSDPPPIGFHESGIHDILITRNTSPQATLKQMSDWEKKSYMGRSNLSKILGMNSLTVRSHNLPHDFWFNSVRLLISEGPCRFSSNLRPSKKGDSLWCSKVWLDSQRTRRLASSLSD